MDSGKLDVLHHRCHIDVLTVTDGIDFALDGVVEETVDEHRVLRTHLNCLNGVTFEHLLLIENSHAATAENEARTHHHGITDLAAEGDCLIETAGGSAFGLADIECEHTLTEILSVFGKTDSLGLGSDDTDSRIFELLSDIERSLTSELNDRTLGFLFAVDGEHVLSGERLKIEFVTGVVVG